MPNQHHARRVSKAFPQIMVRRLRDPLTITVVRDVRVVIANLEHSKLQRKRRKIAMMALSK